MSARGNLDGSMGADREHCGQFPSSTVRADAQRRNLADPPHFSRARRLCRGDPPPGRSSSGPAHRREVPRGGQAGHGCPEHARIHRRVQGNAGFGDGNGDGHPVGLDLCDGIDHAVRGEAPGQSWFLRGNLEQREAA